DSATAPPHTLTPAHSIYRRTPVVLHPTEGRPFKLPPFIKFGNGLHGASDQRYVQRNKAKSQTPNGGSDIDQNRGLQYGALIELVHPDDYVCSVTIPVFADMFRSVSFVHCTRTDNGLHT